MLSFRHKAVGEGITAKEVEKALRAIDYTLKPLAVVLIMTGAGAYQQQPRYLTDQPGMSREATL